MNRNHRSEDASYPVSLDVRVALFFFAAPFVFYEDTILRDVYPAFPPSVIVQSLSHLCSHFTPSLRTILFNFSTHFFFLVLP